jgi:hypothetical protein
MVKKLSIIAAFEFIMVIIAFLIAKDSNDVVNVAGTLTAFMVVGAACLFLFQKTGSR